MINSPRRSQALEEFYERMPPEARPAVNGEVDPGDAVLAAKMRSWCLQREGPGDPGTGWGWRWKTLGNPIENRKKLRNSEEKWRRHMKILWKIRWNMVVTMVLRLKFGDTCGFHHQNWWSHHVSPWNQGDFQMIRWGWGLSGSMGWFAHWFAHTWQWDVLTLLVWTEFASQMNQEITSPLEVIFCGNILF